jgi:hypothetical protein
VVPDQSNHRSAYQLLSPSSGSVASVQQRRTDH